MLDYLEKHMRGYNEILEAFVVVHASLATVFIVILMINFCIALNYTIDSWFAPEMTEPCPS